MARAGRDAVRDAVAAVSRRQFIPDVIWVRRDDGWAVPVRKRDDPERWAAECDGADAVITQVDDGAATDRGIYATSSSTMPSIMVSMLEHLRVAAGMRVLEVGTGTGYNAALLARLAGAENVTSIEVDPALADRARKVLQGAGYPVEVVIGDGTAGCPRRAPFDRLIATAAVRQVPYTWVEQVRPGGLIVVPWTLTVHPEGVYSVLTVRPDGTAMGRFVAPAAFMPLRDQRVSQDEIRQSRAAWEQAGSPSLARYSVTVTPDGQTIRVDPPDGPVTTGREST
ncbi:methyltransferase domain-containing protein [Actinomadura harenae]|uniref:Protein-L-isoaspartate O-methyltransferase n=1 Tax=Actinomadura harenae TaxID=2483351 RepID=A0A3M2LNH1_9ACTN|nr:methyltransferase domain-containing protein [Actinomadura harenae]RMI39014.1 methyltransferase domain-containing protein [Actinomadura harenae]